MDLSLWRNSVPRKLWRRTGIPWLRYSPFTKAQVVNPYGLIWMDMAQPIFFRCTFGPISLKTIVLLKFDFWSDIVSTWLICRQKLRQELPSRIEEAKRSGVRILLNVKGWTWKTTVAVLCFGRVCVCDTINYTSGMQHSLWTESPRFFRNEVIRSWKLQRKDCGNQGRRQPCGTPNQPNLVQNRPMRQVRLEAALTNPSDLKDICFSAVKDKRINL